MPNTAREITKKSDGNGEKELHPIQTHHRLEKRLPIHRRGKNKGPKRNRSVFNVMKRLRGNYIHKTKKT